jgi:hypothetical protein
VAPAGKLFGGRLGGQIIAVAPDQDLVVAFTSADFNQPINYYYKYIMAAIKNDKLEPNPNATTDLSALIQDLEYPKPLPVSPMPKIAKRISGKTFKLQKNDFGFTGFQVNFKNTNECSLIFETPNNKYERVVGLDGLYRISKEVETPTAFGGGTPVACKGQWLETSSQTQTFFLDWLYLGEPVRVEATLTFVKNRVDMVIKIKPTNQLVYIKGKMNFF